MPVLSSRRPRGRGLPVAGLLAVLLVCAATARGQQPDPAALASLGSLGSVVPADLPAGLCAPDWEALFGAEPGVGTGDGALPAGTGRVNVAVVHDDGAGGGAMLYVGGLFESAGGRAASNLARWDGSAWLPVGGGVDGEVHALCSTSFAGATQLWVGGEFASAGGVAADNLARWDGSGFHEPQGGGPNGPVFALLESTFVSDALWVGGSFFQAGGDPLTQNLAVLLHGIDFFDASGTDLNGAVRALAMHDGELYLGGGFTASGSTPLDHLARYDGTLHDVGGGVGGTVYDLASWDDGLGPALVVAGGFPSVGGGTPAGGIAARRGGAWELFGGGVFGSVHDVQVWDDGGGADLYLAGSFVTVGFVPGIEWLARWNGTAFTSVGAGLDDGFARALAVHDDGAGESLWVGGQFYAAGGRAADGVARWDGAWHTTGDGLNHHVDALCTTTFEGTPALYVGGGPWLRAPGVSGDRALARWQTGSWSGLGDVQGAVAAMTVFDDGSGPALYVGGTFEAIDGVPFAHIARWDGGSWSDVGGGLDDNVGALEVWDDGSGPALYVGGQFGLAGGVPADGIARWDGSGWSALGGGLGSAPNVLDMLAYDDGSGEALWVTGQFATVNGAPGQSIARWDGAAWSALGSGLHQGAGTGRGHALAAYDGGAGERLYVGGRFESAGGAPGSAHLAAWTGSAWTGVSGTVNDDVLALAVYDHGDGPLLHLGGRFTQIDLFPLARLARWDGSSWSGMDPGVAVSAGAVNVLHVHQECPSALPRLLVGGAFTVVPGVDPDVEPTGSYLGAWRGCSDDPVAWSDLGSALAGVSGDPLLVGTGTLGYGSTNTLALGNAAALSLAGLFLSFSSAPVPFFGGTLVPFPFIDPPAFLVTNNAGEIVLPFTVNDCFPPGITLYVQYAIDDDAAIFGVALSNAVVGVTP